MLANQLTADQIETALSTLADLFNSASDTTDLSSRQIAVAGMVATAKASGSAADPLVEVGELYDYDVSWGIDTTSSSPRAAAEEAWDSLTRTGSIAHVFTVTDPDGTVTEVDLNEGTERVLPPTIPPGEVAKMRDALQGVANAAEGDSNDTEFDAYRDALDLALTRWPEIDGMPDAVDEDEEVRAELAARITDDFPDAVMEALYDEVHDHSSQTASDTNNNGVGAQVLYLLESGYTETEIRRLLKDWIDDQPTVPAEQSAEVPA